MTVTEEADPVGDAGRYQPLVALTDQDEVAVLHDVMLRSLAELFPHVSLGLYVLSEKDMRWHRVSAVDGDLGEGALAPGLSACLDILQQHQMAGEAHLLESIGGFTCLPVHHGSRLLAAVVLGGSVRSIAPEGYLAALLKIYGNQLAILNRSKHDALTGLFNRHTFDEKVARIFANGPHPRRRPFGAGRGWCLAILDIDHFKRINDGFGHLYGDEVLLLFARIMNETFREEDLLFRYGGEEFVVLLHDVDQDAALAVLDRFRQAVAAFAFPQVGQVTVSIGFTIPLQSLPVPAIVSQADQALYHAKDHGRDQVHSYQLLSSEGHLGRPVLDVPDIEIF